MDGSIESFEPTIGPLQVDPTTAIAAIVIVAVVGSIVVLLYLAFGTETPAFHDDASTVGEATDAATEAKPEAETEQDSAGETEREPDHDPDSDTSSSTQSSSETTGSARGG